MIITDADPFFEARNIPTAVHFVVPGAARGKGRPRAFRHGAGIRLHTDEKTASYEALTALAARRAMAGRPLLEGPVAVVMMIDVAPPLSASKKKRAAMLGHDIRPTGKPDIDNVVKAIFDACNGIVFKDDAQVTSLWAMKRYGEVPGVEVQIKTRGKVPDGLP